jgi:hypothetical protein
MSMRLTAAHLCSSKVKSHSQSLEVSDDADSQEGEDGCQQREFLRTLESWILADDHRLSLMSGPGLRVSTDTQEPGYDGLFSEREMGSVFVALDGTNICSGRFEFIEGEITLFCRFDALLRTKMT